MPMRPIHHMAIDKYGRWNFDSCKKKELFVGMGMAGRLDKQQTYRITYRNLWVYMNTIFDS